MVGMRIRLSVAMVQIGYVDRIRSTDISLITRVDGACERVRLETLVTLPAVQAKLCTADHGHQTGHRA